MIYVVAILCAVAVFFGAASEHAAVAQKLPTIIYNPSGKFDKSFNEAAYNGAERWANLTVARYNEVMVRNEAERERVLRSVAKAGHNPIVMAGFAFAGVLGRVAPDYPRTKFTIIDAVVDLPNVRSIVFKEHEGSYLVGMLAAMVSETGILGFVGGIDSPKFRRFGCGYAQGARSIRPSAQILASFVGSTPEALNDPQKGAELANEQMAQGADVVYAAAGASGLGVLQTTTDKNNLSIGVDSNQNYLYPGSVLTSMIKRVDNAVFDAFIAGVWDGMGGVVVMGLEEGGVGYARDENNVALVTVEMRDRVDLSIEMIISGELKVHDYISDNSCPVPIF